MLPTLDLAGAKGVGRRELDAVPDAFRTAFDPGSGADGAPTLLALEQLDGKEVDSVWCRDHEPVLAALTVGDERAVALLARVPLGRRPSVWRAWVALHPNPAVAYRVGARAAPACPTAEVAVGLVALALGAGDREPLDGLAAVLDQLGDAGRAGRERLAAVRSAAG